MTVHSDGKADTLQSVGGTQALDWFFASSVDQISGATANDTKVTLS
jgi:hypothetical protein